MIFMMVMHVCVSQSKSNNLKQTTKSFVFLKYSNHFCLGGEVQSSFSLILIFCRFANNEDYQSLANDYLNKFRDLKNIMDRYVMKIYVFKILLH